MRWPILLGLLLALLIHPVWAAELRGQWLTLSLANRQLRLELPQTPNEWQRGLQHRQQLAENDGMLFVLSEPQYICFWMVDTDIPLSLAFIDETAHVQHLIDMEPNSDTQYCATAKYVLELNRGWFQRHAVTLGNKIEGLPP